MKIAVIIYGACRLLEFTHQSWDFQYSKLFDIYISTWNKTILKGETNKNNYYEKIITPEFIKQYLPNTNISILKEENYPTLTNAQKMTLHIKNGLNNILLSNINYNLITLIRTDSWITTPNQEEFILQKIQNKNLLETEIYGATIDYETSENGKQPFINDYFFIGNFQKMKTFIETLPDNIICTHKEFAETFIKCNIIPKGPIHLGIQNVRPNITNYPIQEIQKWTKNEDFNKINKEW